jgi:hypothetical protein
MNDCRNWMMGVGCALALLAPVAAVAAEGDQLLATVEKPAVLTARSSAQGISDQSRVIIDVTGFKPAQEGSVQAVVKAQKQDGTEQEIGRFGLFPQTEFKSDVAGAQRYSVPLPKDLASSGQIKLKVELVPGPRGIGEGAQLQIGSAEIR